MGILQNVITGKQPVPPRLMIYGSEGVGKSTFASNAPKAVFIQTEDGLSEIDTCLTYIHADSHQLRRFEQRVTAEELAEYAIGADLVDLRGGTLMPAFVDGHSHMSGMGQARFKCDLTDCRSLEELLQRLEQYGCAVYRTDESGTITIRR